MGAANNVNFVIENNCILRGSRNIRIGNDVTIGTYSFFDASGGSILCGDASSFNRDVYLNASKGGTISIGRFCLIGPGVKIFTANHRFDDRELPIRLQGDTISDVRIGNNCWIGANVVITAGVHIGDGAVIGAGAVVTRDIPDDCLATGVPAKPVKVFKKSASQENTI
jgi:galactoside O-acetyltransferase